MACSGPRRARVMVTDDTAMRLLHATREQLHGKPTREIKPFEVAEKAGINPYQHEYDEALQHLIDNGYVEPYRNSSHGLYRMTNKGIEELLGNP
jgi:predicted transcriptional regulator